MSAVAAMDSLGRKPLRRTIRGGRPYFFADPATDKILNMLVTLSGEVWALRERLAAMEGLHVRQGSLGPGDVDAYEFTAEQEAALAVQRKEFLENLFRVLQERVESAGVKHAVTERPAKATSPRTRPARAKAADRKKKRR